MKNRRPVLGISAGDPAGIGPEITVKALLLPELYTLCRPLVVCDAGVINQIIRLCGFNVKVNVVAHPSDGIYQRGTVDVLDMKNVDPEKFQFNTVSEMNGK